MLFNLKLVRLRFSLTGLCGLVFVIEGRWLDGVDELAESGLDLGDQTVFDVHGLI